MGDVQDGVGPSIREMLAEGNPRYQGIGDGPDGPPPSVYQFQLVGAELKMIGKDAKRHLAVQWTHVVLEGEHQGEQMVDFSHPKHEKKFVVKMMRQRIQRLGWPAPSGLPDLEELVPEIEAAGPIYTGKVTHDGNYANIEVLKLIEQYGARSGGQVRSATPAAAPTASPARLRSTRAPNLTLGDNVSFTDDEGTEYVGVVSVALDARGDVGVKVEGIADTFYAPAEEFTPVTEAVEAAEPGLDELIAFAERQGITEIDPNIELADLAAFLTEQAYEAKDLDDDEAALLVGLGVVIKPKPPSPPKPTAKPKARAKPKAAKPKAAKPKPKAKRRT